MATSEECPPETKDWLATIKATETEEERFLLAGAIFIQKIARVQCRLFNIMASRDHVAAREQYWVLIADLDAAEHEFDSFCAWWLPLSPAPDFFVFGLRDSAIVKVYTLLILFINFMTHDPACEPYREEFVYRRALCVNACRRAADSILETAPRVIEPLKAGLDKSPAVIFEAFKIIWPLICVFLISGTRPDQKQKAEEILTFLGSEIGIRQGLRSYEKAELPLPPEVRTAHNLPALEEIEWAQTQLQ